MTIGIARWLPRSIGGQIALLIVVANACLHLGISAVFFLERHKPGERAGAEPGVVAALVRILETQPLGPDQARLLAEFNIAIPTANFSLGKRDDQADQGQKPQSAALLRELGPGYSANIVGRIVVGETELEIVAVPLRHGGSIMATLANDAPPRLGTLVIPILVIFVSVVTLGLWAARQLTTPLQSFADAAETFGFETEPEPLPESGPEEIKSLARALNNMRGRIKKLVDERTHMLASVGHDLRTPITRLRLRTEFMEPGLRTTMLRDLDQMTGMVDSALSHLRDGVRSEEKRIIVDLPSLLQTVCDEFTDLGKDVTYEGPDHALVTLIPGDMHRAVANLVDNATSWGTRAVLRLVPPAQGLAIEVEDNGPGIPEDALERMTLPFVRGDEARNLNGSTGFGLGLSVVSMVAEAHGGRLHLSNKPEGGLIARIELPVAA